MKNHDMDIKTEKSSREPKVLFGAFVAVAILLVIVGFLLGRQGTAAPDDGDVIVTDGGTIITSAMIDAQLHTSKELVSAKYMYTAVGMFENSKEIFGLSVPGTTKKVIVKFDGTILAGIDLSDVHSNVQGKSVTITLPQPYIISHEVDEDSVSYLNEKESMFNKLEGADYSGLIQAEKEAMEGKAKERGLLTEAVAQAEPAIRGILSLVEGIEDYSVSFVYPRS